jgi:hypothetical protein
MALGDELPVAAVRRLIVQHLHVRLFADHHQAAENLQLAFQGAATAGFPSKFDYPSIKL